MNKLEDKSVTNKCRTFKRKTKTFACTCCCCCCYLFSGARKYFPSYNVKMAFNHNCAMHWLFSLVLKSEMRHSTTEQQTAETLRLSEHIFNSFIRICIVLQLSLQLKHHYSPPRYHSDERGFILKIEGVLEATILLESGPSVGPKQSFLSSLLFLSSWSEGFQLFSFTVDLWVCQGCLGAIYHGPGSSCTLTH